MLAWMLYEMGRSRGIISQPRMGSASPRARWRERPQCGDRPKEGPIQPASSTAVSLGRKRFACLVLPRRRRGAAELPALLRGSSVRILHCTTLSSVCLLDMHCHATVLRRTPYPPFVHSDCPCVLGSIVPSPPVVCQCRLECDTNAPSRAMSAIPHLMGEPLLTSNAAALCQIGRSGWDSSKYLEKIEEQVQQKRPQARKHLARTRHHHRSMHVRSAPAKRASGRITE
jgi:hypothetical protein